MTAVTIPADLAAEIRTDLASTSARVRSRWLFQGVPRECSYVTAQVDDTTVYLAVGSVDGGPRPDVGDRVLALSPGVGVVTVAPVDGYGAWGRFPGADYNSPVTRWAVLPPAPAEPAKPHLWVCGCLINSGGAHRVGCPDHPQGIDARPF